MVLVGKGFCRVHGACQFLDGTCPTRSQMIWYQFGTYGKCLWCGKCTFTRTRYRVPTERTLRHSHQRPIKISGNETHNSFERTFLSKKKIKLVHDGLFQFCRSPSHCRRSRSVLRGDRRLLSRIPGYRPRKATIIAHSSSHLLLARRSYHLL